VRRAATDPATSAVNGPVRGPAAPSAHDRFDRISVRRDRPRDGLGKEALYSTAPTAAPTTQVELRCTRCDVPFGLSVVAMAKLVLRPFVWDPIRGRLWTRCPSCERRAWLTVRAGQALRVLLDRRP
jgi:hypothetical protein